METQFKKSQGCGKRHSHNNERLHKMPAFKQGDQGYIKSVPIKLKFRQKKALRQMLGLTK